MNEITIIIVNYNLTNCIKTLLESIYRYSYNVDFDIYVVDNNSTDRSIEKLITLFPKVKFELLKTNYGFGHANNYVIKRIKSKYYFLLNPDTELIENSIKAIHDFMELHSNIGIAGHMHIRKDGSIQLSAQKFPNIVEEFLDIFLLTPLYIKIQHKIKTFFNKEYYFTDFVYGSCMMIRGEVFNKVEPFDEDYFLFAEETDLCFRVKNKTNYKIAYVSNIKLIHLGGEITNKIRYERIKRGNESKLIFFIKNYSPPRHVILRLLKIISFVGRILIIIIKGQRGNKTNYIRVYWYLIKYYFLGQPVLNKLH